VRDDVEDICGGDVRNNEEGERISTPKSQRSRSTVGADRVMNFATLLLQLPGPTLAMLDRRTSYLFDARMTERKAAHMEDEAANAGGQPRQSGAVPINQHNLSTKVPLNEVCFGAAEAKENASMSAADAVATISLPARAAVLPAMRSEGVVRAASEVLGSMVMELIQDALYETGEEFA
jgi:hypothetical protein